MDQIETIFKTDQFCCLHGVNGSGKSFLAKKYCSKNQTSSSSSLFKQIKWIDADCFEKILFNFKLLLNELKLCIESKSIYDFFDKLKLTLNEYAAKENVKFLLIIDNLLNERDIDLLMFGFNLDSFKFLITTTKQLSLDEFNNLKRIELTNTESFSFKTNNNQLKIKQECLKASDFLNYLAYLDGNWNLTHKLIRFLFLDEETLNFEQSLNYLINNNLLQYDQINNRFGMHTLIQNEIIKQINTRKNFILDRLVFTLNSLFVAEYIEQFDLIQMEHYFKHGIKILKEDWKTKSANLNTAELYYKIGLVYDSVLFEYSDALDNYREALDIFKSHKKTIEINECLNKIANDYIRLDLNEEAVLILKEILTKKESAAIFSLLGLVYEKLKQYDDALDNYLKSIDLLKLELNGGISLQIADEYYKIACIYLNQKNYSQSIENYKHVLKIRKELLVSNHPSIAKCLLDLANINYKLGKHDESLKSYKDALRILNKSNDNDQTDLVHISNMIGNIHFSTGQFEEALKNYKEALRIKRESNINSNNTINKAMILNNMGLVLSRLDKCNESLEHFKEALQLKKESLVENHFSIANTLNNMGNVYFKMKQIDLALENYNEAYRIFNSMTPCNYSSKADTLANIGVCYKCLGNHDLALDTYNQVLNMRKEKTILSMHHPSIAKIYNNIGNVYRQIGKHDEALNNYKESLRIYKETLPSNHFSIANVLFNMDIINKN
jgi:tetratricopeptide (TPR) repeat protein